MVHCFSGEMGLTKVQEMFRPRSLCDWPGCGTPSLWIGGKGLGTETKPSERHHCILDGFNYNRTLFHVNEFFSPADSHTHTHICLDLWTLCSLLTDVTLKVHLSDASTHQPLGGVTIQLFANHTSVTTETSSAEGNTYLRFPYRLGTPLVVTATKQGYVPNSVPWTPSRLPGKWCLLCVCARKTYLHWLMFLLSIACLLYWLV